MNFFKIRKKSNKNFNRKKKLSKQQKRKILKLAVS